MVTRKKTAKSAAKAPAKKKSAALTKRMNKTEILAAIADNTGLTRSQVSAVLTELESVIEQHLCKRTIGEFQLPGLLKIKAVRKPAQKARKNVPNPFRPGETMDVAAKPASMKVRVLPLKRLKSTLR